MEGNVMQYLDYVFRNAPPEILSLDSYQKLNTMTSLFRDFAASEYIMETHLNTTVPDVDFSFRILAEERECLINALKQNRFVTLADDIVWQRIVDFVDYWSISDKTSSQWIDNVWFEMDSGEHVKYIPQPCFFLDAAQVKKDSDMNFDLLFNSLQKLLNKEQVELLQENLKSAIGSLPPNTGLYQVGTMLARNKDRVRLFTSELTLEQTVEYLQSIGWRGPFAELDRIFNLVHGYSDGQYILDFDVYQEGVSEKIGINFGLENNKSLPAFLDNLVKHGMCSDIKKRGVLSWKGSSCKFLGQDYGQTALIKNISHFKVSFSPGEELKAKAYLRLAGVYLKDLFKTKPN